VQVVAPDKPNCPAGHAVQKEVPVELLIIPAEHAEQVEEPE